MTEQRLRLLEQAKWPQWSQPEIGWVTAQPEVARPGERVAAMEPAGDRLGDDDGPELFCVAVDDAAMEPAGDRLGDRSPGSPMIMPKNCRNGASRRSAG